MAYRYEKQVDGNFTVRDIAIFAGCKRGESDFGEAWMDKAVAIANAEESMGYLPPVFVKHNESYSPTGLDDETTDGRLSSMRRSKVRVRGSLEDGIVANIIDVPATSLDKIVKHRLPGRSIESVQPMTRNKIDGLALLGRTPPYHTLAQGSEPHFEMFSLAGAVLTEEEVASDVPDKTVVHFTELFMADEAPGPSALNPAMATSTGAPEDLIRAIADLLKGYMAPSEAPSGDDMAPAADRVDRDPETRPVAYMQRDNPEAEEMTKKQEPSEATELELLKTQFDLLVQQNESLKAQLAETSEQVAEKGEDAARAEAEAGMVALFGELRDEHLVFSEDYVREQVAKFGLDEFRKSFKPLMIKAPVTPPGGLSAQIAAPSREAASSHFSAFDHDADLKTFAALSPQLRQIAMAAAVEYDAEVTKWAGFAENNPREHFISREVKRAQINNA